MEQPETAGSRAAGAAPRDHDVGSFDRRAGSYERDWRSPFHAQVVAASVEVALAAVPHPAAVLADLFAVGWLRPISALGRRRDRIRTIAESEALLIAARLAPLAWRPVYDLGPLQLIGAVVAAPARPGDASGAGYRPDGNG